MTDLTVETRATVGLVVTSDAGRFRAWRREQPLAGFECLDTEPRRAARRYFDRGNKIITGRWHCGAFLVEPLAPPLAWDDVPRSTSFHLHSWDPFATLLMAHSGSGDPQYLRYALSITVDWLDRYAKTGDSAIALSMREGFAWYDMAVGMRSYRLGYLLDALAREDWTDDATVDPLLHSLLQHLEVLSDEGFLAANSNHDFCQAWRQLAATWRHRAADRNRPYYEQVTLRLRQMLRQQFFDEGTHRKHSSGYHLETLSTTFRSLRFFHSLSGARADRTSNTISPSGRSGRLIWDDDFGLHRLNFQPAHERCDYSPPRSNSLAPQGRAGKVVTSTSGKPMPVRNKAPRQVCQLGRGK